MYYEEEIQKKTRFVFQTKLKQNESYFIRACFKKHALYIMKIQKKKRERETQFVYSNKMNLPL